MKDTLTEMKTALGGLPSRLEGAEGRRAGLEDISESLKTQKQREQSLRKTDYPRTMGHLQKFQYTCRWEFQKEKKERNRRNICDGND